MYLSLFIIVLSLLLSHGDDSDTVVGLKHLNYSYLAEEAESHKSDILTFLNKSHIKEEYKKMFNKLLTQLKSSGSTRRIVSGRNTSISALPWQVSLREKTYPICGGSIITDIWLLTAAHCLLRSRASELSVRLGSSWKTHGGEMYDVKESFVHPRYASKTKVNDVGLLRLYSPLRFSARILPIKIIAKGTILPANERAIVSGWGKMKEGGTTAAYLQSVIINTIAMKLCRRSGLDKNAIHPATMFCAGSFSQSPPDACQGDSGGPIVYEGELIGVVSWGLGCARGNFPGVYTRLANPVIHDWVSSNIGQKYEDDNT